MKTDTHNSSIAAGVIGNGTFSDKPTSQSSPHSTLKPSNCRRRVPCKGAAYCSTARENILAGMFLRRTTARYFLILPLLYFSGLLTCVGSLSGLLNMHPGPLPGSVYRSHEIFKNLLHDIQADNSSQIELPAVWKYKRKLKEQKPCLSPAADPYFENTVVHQYLIVEAKGGLTQQQASICNAVALAGLLNATLVIPHLKFHNVWKDPSEFGDIYDEDHFITTLKDHVHVVHELPKDLMERYDFNISNIPNFRVPAWSSANYYLEKVYPILHQQRVVRISPFENRLAVNLPPHIRYLRCLANFEALKFSLPITLLAKTLVQRMTANSSSSGGKYISIHLRFEEDMVAFSCCVYDGGDAEYRDMNLLWKKKLGEKFKGKDCVIAPDLNRVNGRCPMTPLEVGMMLRGMGFANTTAIYLASGKLYQSDRILGPLREMFPLLHTKELLATPDELASLQGYSSRLAALDYLVCLFSEVFVMTQGGSFPQFLMAHRKFLYSGHAKTINPDKRKLVVLLHNTSISWKSLKDEMQLMLAESDRKGIMVPRAKKTKKRNSPIFSNPLVECRCIWESQTSTL